MSIVGCGTGSFFVVVDDEEDDVGNEEDCRGWVGAPKTKGGGRAEEGADGRGIAEGVNVALVSR